MAGEEDISCSTSCHPRVTRTVTSCILCLQGNPNLGVEIPVLQQSGAILDFVNVMSYDAGPIQKSGPYPGFDSRTAIEAYAKYVPKNKIALGIELGDQWGNFKTSLAEAKMYATYVQQNGFFGCMFWSYNRDVQSISGAPDLSFHSSVAAIVQSGAQGMFVHFVA